MEAGATVISMCSWEALRLEGVDTLVNVTQSVQANRQAPFGGNLGSTRDLREVEGHGFAAEAASTTRPAVEHCLAAW